MACWLGWCRLALLLVVLASGWLFWGVMWRQAGAAIGWPACQEGAIVPISSAPVDPARFSMLIFMGCQPKTDRETGAQITTADGSARKWTAVIAATKPSPYDSTRVESDTLQVTITAPEDPADGLPPGSPVTLLDFSAGVMPPEAREGGKISGGRLFWSATGIRPAHGGKS